MSEWTDSYGTRAVYNAGRLSLFGEPSMTSLNGEVAMGIDVTPEALEALAQATRDAQRILRWET